jgi:hypothetical protein
MACAAIVIACDKGRFWGCAFVVITMRSPPMAKRKAIQDCLLFVIAHASSFFYSQLRWSP